jgi:hypothetical protein
LQEVLDLTTFQIELSGPAVAGLQESVTDFNVATGQSLSLEDWIILSLTQKAIERDINMDVDRIKKEADAEVPRRIDARRRELIAALGKCRAVRVSPGD